MKIIISVFILFANSITLWSSGIANAEDWDPEVVELLKKASSYLEEDEKQRQESIARLIEIGETAVPYLCTRLNTDNVMENIALVIVLSKIGEPAVEELHKALNHEEEKARRFTMGIIARIGSPNSLDVFKNAMNDSEWSMRANAAAGLGVMKGDEARTLLLILIDDDDPDVRLRALLALADMDDDELMREIAKRIDDPSFMVRFGAAEVLADKREGTVPLLKERLDITGSRIIRLLIIETLGNTGSPLAADIIKPFLYSENIIEKCYAITAFSKTAPAEDIKIIRGMLETEKTIQIQCTFKEAINTLESRSK